MSGEPNRDAKPVADTYFLRSLNHSLDIIEALSNAGQSGVTELGKRLGLSKGAVHRILTNLVARGYVDAAGNGQYRLALRLWEVGLKVPAQARLRDVVSPRLHELMDTVHESVLLSVYQDGEVIYLDKVTSEQAVQTYTRIGGRNPAYAVASGKVLLAHQPDRELQRVLSRPLRAMTPSTITDPAKLRAELDSIRQRGYALNLGECRADVNGVGAVLRDSQADPVAAISVSGPAYRFDRETIDRTIEPLNFTASTISKQLGYVPR